MLRKEARAPQEVVDIGNTFISTTVESTELRAPQSVPIPTETVSLVGAIELSEEENLLAREGF